VVAVAAAGLKINDLPKGGHRPPFVILAGMYSYLALGDSYTIGEGVPLSDSFPYQTVQLLRGGARPFCAPEILARTGWTTDELAAAMDKTRMLLRYDLVTLLIGVNNQYRGRAADEYGAQFEALLLRAVSMGTRVIVLSIPDWGVSPFAKAGARDPRKISQDIGIFNGVASTITRRHRVQFIDVTTHSRTSAVFTADGLHPAGETYRFWAQQLAASITGSPTNPGQ
jgi:lysophospholipase L1-like esterase